MVTDTFVEDYNSNGYSYYFGSNGAMVTNTWVAIDPSIVSNAGDNAPSAYWYYFGANGKCYKASAGNVVKKTIDGKKYMFDEYGKMMTGWFTSSGDNQDAEDNPFEAAIYYAGAENDGVLRSGWLAYYDGTDQTYGSTDYSDKDVLWFYFDTSNNKKIAASTSDKNKEKTINGKKYAFESSGVMKSKWVKTNETDYKYYSKDTDGHLAKKGWIYEVPNSDQSKTKNDDDEEYWFYANASGDLNKGNIKKINGKYYAFDGAGIMQKGLVVFKNGTYVATIDLEKTNVDDLLKLNKVTTKTSTKVKETAETESYTIDATNAPTTYDLHYFGESGDRKTGDITIEFADDEATFTSTNNGGKRGLSKKKIYHNGLLCKASADIKYAIAIEGDGRKGGVATIYELTDEELASGTATAYGFARVVTNSGAKAVKDNEWAVKKDADGNYWVIANSQFRFVSSAEVKYSTFAGWVKTKNTDKYTYYKSGTSKVFQFKGTVAEKFFTTEKKDKAMDAKEGNSTTYTSGSKDGWVPFMDSDSTTESIDAADANNKQMQYKTVSNVDNVVPIKKEYLTNLIVTNVNDDLRKN